MNLETSLIQFGLNSKEASVYLAALELGGSPVLKIAKKAELKRPTVYLVLESLIDKGLINKNPRGSTTYYFAENPENLISSLKERTNNLESVLPELKSIFSQKKGKPNIRFYEGKKTIEQIWLNDVFKHQKVDFISSITDLLEKYPEMMETYLELSGKQITTRELITKQPADIKYAKKNSKPKQQIRILPNDYIYSMDINIYGNKVFLVSLKDDFAVLIESEAVYQSFQSLYNLAWLSAEKV